MAGLRTGRSIPIAVRRDVRLGLGASQESPDVHPFARDVREAVEGKRGQYLLRLRVHGS